MDTKDLNTLKGLLAQYELKGKKGQLDFKEFKDKVDNKEFFDIKGIEDLLDLSHMRINNSIRNGSLRSKLTKFPNSNQVHHICHIYDIGDWRSKISKGSKRSDSRNKYVIYCDKDELDKVSRILKENNMTIPTIKRANVKKI